MPIFGRLSHLPGSGDSDVGADLGLPGRRPNYRNVLENLEASAPFNRATPHLADLDSTRTTYYNPAVGAGSKFCGIRLAQLVVAFLIASVLCTPAKTPAAQASKTTTFEYKEARSPAESGDSIKLLERALELTQTALGPDDRAVGELAYRLAQRYDDAGDYDRALQLYERSLVIQETIFGLEDRGVADRLNDLGVLQEELQNYAEALRFLRRSLDITQKVYGPEHYEVANTLALSNGLLRHVGMVRAGASNSIFIGQLRCGILTGDPATRARGCCACTKAPAFDLITNVPMKPMSPRP
jgi:tetratricopeptide (TPR) repeat protein